MALRFHSRSWIGLVLVIFLAASLISLSSYPVRATPAVKLVSLPNCSTATGMFYDSVNRVVWQPCYDTGILYKEDYSTNPATVTAYDLSAFVGPSNAIAIWGDSSNLYVVGRGGGGSLGGVVKSPLSSPVSATVPLSGLLADVLYPTMLNGFLYLPYNGAVAKFDTTTSAVVTISTGQQMFQCVNDGNLVYCTSHTSGRVYEINPSTNLATLRVSGLNEPYGIAADSSSLYVAQHGTNSVVKISKSTWGITATSSLPAAATPYGVLLFGSLVIVSSDSSGATFSPADNLAARNIYVLSTTNMATTSTVTCPVLENGQCRPLFILISDGTNLFVGFQGSAGSAQISNWQPVSTVTTTLTSVVNNNCVFATQSCVIVYLTGGIPETSSTTTTTSTTTSSSTTASSTTWYFWAGSFETHLRYKANEIGQGIPPQDEPAFMTQEDAIAWANVNLPRCYGYVLFVSTSQTGAGPGNGMKTPC